MTGSDLHQLAVRSPEQTASESGGAETIDSAESFDERVAVAFAFESDRRRAWEIERLFESMTADEAPAILEMILANPEYHKPFGLLGPFFGKWGELDGASAYAASTKLEGREKRDAEKYLFPTWARADVHAAWKPAEASLLDPSRRSRSWHGNWEGAVIREMAKQDPDTLIRMVASDPNRSINESLRGYVTAAAFEADQLPELLRKVNRTENDEDRAEWTRQIYMRWTAKDPDAPLEAIAAIQDRELATAAMEGFLAGWSHTDSAGAIDYALDHLNDPAVERSLVSMVRSSLYRGSPEENTALVDRLAEIGALDRIGRSLSAILPFNRPEVAMQISEKLTDDTERAALQERAMRMWAGNDFDAARNYYDQLPSTDTKAKLLPVLASELYRRSDGGTLLVSLLESVPNGQDRAAVVESLLASASRERARASKDFLVGLELIANSESGLSENAQALRSKLFGDEP